MTKEEAWTIVNGKCTLPEAMKIFGRTETEINEKMEDLKSRQSSFAYFAIGNTYASLSYDFLVKEGEIDNTKIFNMASKSFDESLNMIGDIGKMGDKTYRYTNEGWQIF